MDHVNYPFLILLTGGLMVLTVLLRAALDRTPVPPLVGFLLIGLFLRWLDERTGLSHPGTEEVLGFLGKIGVILLLFKIGLESDLQGLMSQLRRASMVWCCNVLASGLLGFAAAFRLLNLAMIPSLVVATAMTATSVGISIAVWERAEAAQSENGEFLIDVAELDDISAVVLMALLFALLPQLREAGLESGMMSGDLLATVGKTAGLFFLRIVAFGMLCYLFSRYVERHVTEWIQSVTTRPTLMILVISIGLIFAAAAGLLKFSLAIGAFFAGLVFSRDPRCVKEEAAILPLYEMFTPFFFIGIGLELEPAALGDALWLGGALTAVAIGTKLLANVVPVYFIRGFQGATLIGISMVPRAEITMIIMQKGAALGDWAAPPSVFAAMVLVCAVTCLAAPVAVQSLLRRWPQGGQAAKE
ncbi:MAG: cation:proton antiporter [Desulfococcaceae bacterium]